METHSIVLRGADKEWVASATRVELLAALSEAGEVQSRVDVAMTLCRAELARRRAPGCGHAAADEADACAAAGVSRSTGRRHERRAHLVGTVPVAAEALARGTIGGEHLDALTDVVPDELMDAVAEQGEALFSDAAGQTADGFRRSLRFWVRDVQRERGIDRAAQQRAARSGRCSISSRSGMIELRAELDPVVGAQVQHRVRIEYRRLLQLDQEGASASAVHPEADPRRTVEQRWADAIVSAITAGGRSTKAADDRLPIVVVDSAVLAEHTDAGRCEIPSVDEVPPETARRMACDRPVLALSVDPHGKPVALTSFNRHANVAQRRALQALYGGCVGPDCTVGFGDCHVHHTVPWSSRPVTSVAELAPLCTRHHHLVHEGGWRLAVRADATIEWTSPSGQMHTRRPHRPPGDPPHAGGRASSTSGPQRNGALSGTAAPVGVSHGV